MNTKKATALDSEPVCGGVESALTFVAGTTTPLVAQIRGDRVLQNDGRSAMDTALRKLRPVE
jgi:hypothetical protein